MSKDPAPYVDLAIRNDLAELVSVTNALDRFAERAAIPGKTLIQLQVALDETLSNIIRGWRSRAEDPHRRAGRADRGRDHRRRKTLRSP